jgi:DNA gyrase subunit A
MDQLGLHISGSHRKCARVVGEVLGKSSITRNMSIYDALVRWRKTLAPTIP